MNMDRSTTLILLTTVILLWTGIATGLAIAAPASSQQSPQKQVVTNDSALGPVADESSLASRFPSLQRALIIACITNFIVIIFALLFYFAKRRMIRFAPARAIRNQQEN